MQRVVMILGIAVVLSLVGCGKKTGASGAECGNGRLEMGEECDGDDVGIADCEGLGLEGGALGCNADCTFDVTQCTGDASCGNGVIEYPEQCDTADLAGEDCESQGFDSGTLGCTSACTLDTSQCEIVAVCGDGEVEGGEECDGADLADATCESLGLGSGDLACGADCHFDVSGCDQAADCGNDAREYPEDCDGADLAGEDCVSQGFDGGTLGCAMDCAFDTSGCTTAPVCGDGVAEAPEACDGTDLAGQDCASQGFGGGALGCAVDCTFDTSGCVGDTVPVCVPDPTTPVQRDESSGAHVVSFTCTDADGDSLSVATTDSSAVPDGGVAFGNDGPGATVQVWITLDPDSDDAGPTGSATFDVSFTIQDADSNLVTVVQTVTFDNLAPTFTPDPVPDLVVTVGQVAVVDVTFADADGDALGFTETSPGYASFTSAGSVATFTFAPVGAGDDSGVADPVSVTGDDGQGGTATATFTVEVNQVPLADAGPDVAAAPGATVQLDGTGSSDPDGDPLTYLWTPGAGAPPLDDPTSPTPSLIGGACNQVYTYTLVVNDGYVDSAPDTVTVTLSAVGPYVSEADCIPFDECGDLTRPWCTITGGVQAARANGFPTVYVKEGTYPQGAAAQVAETLVIDAAPGGADPEILGGYTDLATLTRAAAPSCDTSVSGATLVQVNTAQGIRFTGGTTNLFERFCVRSVAAGVVMPRKANITVADASPHIRGNIVDAIAGGMIDTTVGIDVVSSDLSTPIQPIIEQNTDDPSTGLVFGGDGMSVAVGVSVSGYVDLQLLQNDFTGGMGSAASGAVGFIGQGNLTATQNNLSGGDGTSSSRGLYLQRNAGVLDATLTQNVIVGGTSTGTAHGAHFLNASTVLCTTGNQIDGRTANSGGGAYGLRFDNVADAEVSSGNIVRGGTTGSRAYGIWATNGSVVRVTDGNTVSGGVDGTAVGSSAVLVGIYADQAASLVVGQNDLVSGAMIDPGTLDPYLGGSSAVGVHADTVPSVTVDDNLEILGGGIPLGLSPGTSTPQAIGIRALNGDQLSVTLNGLIQGCAPHCGPGNSNPTPTPRVANGIGVLVQDESGGGLKEITQNAQVLGGPILAGSFTASVGVDVQQRSNMGAVWVDISDNTDVVGNIEPDAGIAVNRPQYVWGVRVFHAGVGVFGNQRIAGGRGSVEAVGINGEQTGAPTTSISADSNVLIIGNPYRDNSVNDPGSVYGIRFDAGGTGWSDLFVNGAVGLVQEIAGGYARANMQGTAVGLDAAEVDQAWISNNRIWGGVVPGGLVQRGARVWNCNIECMVSANLIEACGVVDGAGTHDVQCEDMWARSIGLYVMDGRAMPTFVWNNLVFGGFSQSGATGMRLDDSGNPGANAQVYNNYINAQGQRHAACGAIQPDARAIHLAVTAGGVFGGAGLDFHNNIIDAGGRSCLRYGVYEDGNGFDAFIALAFTHNVWVQAIASRDNNPIGSQTWGYHESTGVQFCQAGVDVIGGIPDCLNNPIAPTNAIEFNSNLEGDPVFQGTDTAISEGPGFLPLSDFHATALVLQSAGTKVPLMMPPGQDYEGDPRPDPVTCDIGHDETP